MSISSDAVRKAGPFTGNGSTTAFPFAFKVFLTTDVVVTIADLTGTERIAVLGTDYSVTLNSNQDSNPGGTVTTTSALTSGYLLAITSNVPQTQPVVLTNSGNFYPQTLNDEFDRLTIFAQQLSELISRAVVVPVTDSTSPQTYIQEVFTSATNAQNSATAAASSASSAATSATNAANSASSASTSATTATNEAGIATTQATNAANSATSAATSATNSANSATASASSASSAATSATNAATSATNAANSAASASNSATSAATSATNAQNSATAAASSASSAANSASSASTSATTATNQASLATTEANNAASSATSAANSATSASTSATSAANSASAAATSASQAATSATNAANSATSAANSATSAANSASTAQTLLIDFQNEYYGPLSADPTARPSGGAIMAGDLYYNTSLNAVRVYNGTSWQAVGVQFNPTAQQFNGDGTTTSFALTASPGTAAALIVAISGVLQEPILDYNISGANLTFTNAPPIGTKNINVINFGVAGSVTVAANVSGGSSNELLVQTGADSTGFITAPSAAGTFLEWDGTQFVWNTVTEPVISAGSGISVAQTGSDYAISTSYTAVQQGGGAGQGTNKLYMGWSASGLLLQVDSTNFGNTWPISISGNAGNGAVAWSNSNAGYVKFGNGTIFQWGIFYMTGNTTVTFPIAFPNAAISVQCNNDNGQGYGTTIISLSTTNVQLRQQNGAGHNVFWLAQGY